MVEKGIHGNQQRGSSAEMTPPPPVYDLGEEKTTVEEYERDKEVYLERLRRAEYKREMAQEMLEDAEAQMMLNKFELDTCENKMRELRQKQKSSNNKIK